MLIQWIENFPIIIGLLAHHQKILAGLNLVQQPLVFQSDIEIVKPYSMATACSVAESSNLGLGGAKPGAWPRELLFLGHASDVYVQSESNALLGLRALIMMLKVMIIIIVAKAISSGSSAGTNTNRDLAAITNRNLWNRAASWVIIAFLLDLLLKLKCPEHKFVVLSLPLVLWHRWDWHDVLLWMVRANAVSSTRHRFDVWGHASAIGSHRATLEGNGLLDERQFLKNSWGQLFGGFEEHCEWLHHPLDVVLDASLINAVICLKDMRGGVA